MNCEECGWAPQNPIAVPAGSFAICYPCYSEHAHVGPHNNLGPLPALHRQPALAAIAGAVADAPIAHRRDAIKSRRDPAAAEMSAIHHTADGLILPLKIDKVRAMMRRFRVFRVLPWWNALRVRNQRR